MPDGVIRVLVVEDHDLVVLALARLLESQPGVEIVATTGSGTRALALVENHPVDVVVLDRRLDDGADGIDLIEKFRELSPGIRIIMLTGSPDDRSVARAVEAGCHGYLIKSQPGSEIAAGVLAVARGEMVFSPLVMSKVMRLLRPQNGSSDELSAREVEVLQHLAEGATTEQIAEALFVSVNTVRNHIHNVIRKLGAHSRLEAVSVGLRRGIIDVT